MIIKRYSPPLKIYFLIRIVLFMASIWMVMPLLIFVPGSIIINGLEYQLSEPKWLVWIGSFNLFFIGLASLMILKNIKNSLSFLGGAILLSILVTTLHPFFVFELFISNFLVTFLISFGLIIYDINYK